MCLPEKTYFKPPKLLVVFKESFSRVNDSFFYVKYYYNCRGSTSANYIIFFPEVEPRGSVINCVLDKYFTCPIICSRQSEAGPSSAPMLHLRKASSSFIFHEVSLVFNARYISRLIFGKGGNEYNRSYLYLFLKLMKYRE